MSIRRNAAVSTASLGLFVFGWLWMAANFSVASMRWWNTQWAMLAIFATGATLAATAKPFKTFYGAGSLVLNLLMVGAWLILIFGE